MAEGHVAHRAAALAWLSPSAPRLAALADSATDVANDPASVLLMLRFSRPTPTLDTVSVDVETFQQSSILEAAATYLESNSDGWADPAQPEIVRILQLAKLIATKAESLAAISGNCSPDAARVAGLLVPLGWLAVATVEPKLAEACRTHDEFNREPGIVENHLWGLSADAIARRLVHRWRLPAWLANTLTTLRLPVKDAVRLVADANLTRILRFAVEAAESQGTYLGLIGPRSSTGSQEEIEELEAEPAFPGLEAATDPRTVPLLTTLLRSTANTRRNAGFNRVVQLETQIDSLQSALQDSRNEFDESLRDAKLVAMAELAAGAGHEINNPLAVISGNAQLLRAREEDADRRKSLDIIVRQTARVAEILQDLMQFARPAKATTSVFSIVDLFAAIERETNPLAALKAVSLRIAFNDASKVFGDAHQIKKALGNLVRNAIDVTPTAGSVRVYTRSRADSIEIVVEDTGPGPSPESVPHLFDPFFSGRSAGRGRGLGLSTAWSYARQNGGTLHFESHGAEPTRFILTLQLADAIAMPERQSA